MLVKDLSLTKTAYFGANGNFGLLVPQADGKFAVKWYSCREEFATASNDTNKWTMPENGFLFYHNKKAEDIAEFIGRFESLLEIGRRKPLIKSVIQKINTNKVVAEAAETKAIWVTPGPFWLQQTMRFSLFTMLFRCANFGYVSGDGDFFSALYLSYNLAMACKNSISRFLDGYTWYHGKNNGLVQGWYNTFNSGDANAFNTDYWKILTRPKPKVKKEEKVEKDAILKEDNKKDKK